MSNVFIDTLRAVAGSLQIPTVIILLLLILLTVVMLGGFIVEALTERRTLKVSIPELVDSLHGKSIQEVEKIIDGSGLLPRQKKAYQEVVKRTALPDDLREALARQMAADEEYRYRRTVKVTDLIARIAPMFGLMGTLIPLGPGLIALGQGDTKTLSDSLMIAFDTTIAGLVTGAVSYFISGVRKGWYEQYMSWTQTIMETILNVQATERKKIYKQLQQQKARQEAQAGAAGAGAQTGAAVAGARSGEVQPR
ncbi:MAG: MotA/TolQ/ExbB proton channel family protein [Firmicutes bacterium]|nr:MotA/TolQ/ExbB proton channel family protein [Bacillota bacterium]